MRASFFPLTTLALALASAHAARAQETEFQAVDRVAAIVGDSVISLSRVEEELNVYRQRGGEIPTDSAQRMTLMRQLLSGIVDQQLLLQAALRDTSIVVSEQEVQVAVERAVRKVRSQFASELEFRRELDFPYVLRPEAKFKSL